MAVLKCKMCGGDLTLIQGASTATCEFCGRVQTVPKGDDNQKLTLFARANRLRAACDFDKSAGIYENIIAQFPEESEAYWGLVLCKYGIEYVDDPATGKKIPTCHRTGFESVLKDENLDQAMENADLTAQRVLREEAKQIEELRSAIVAVSAKEAPYDIFICYKETDQAGNRTLDSVLAQDIYDALTQKGYRVFFARISLEDKLGKEYEPYIFAALNSARLMLVVGTAFEYFNAVWVKNEWKRFLDLMAKDKEKHLIPCYKGVDAYDMPEEFARLQAQDLGKLGAIQDLLRGVEKLMPKTAVFQEQVVVGGSVENKIATLLERGNMALEDGDWSKADSFFEDVLNTDAKHAQAYLGKALARERCRTIDALIRKRKEANQRCRQEKVQLPPDQPWEDAFVQRYLVPGYLEERVLRKRLSCNRIYLSNLPGRQRNYEEELAYWEKHQWLSRAEQFAQGTLADHLASEKRSLMAALAEQIKAAEQEDQEAREAAVREYRRHLETVEEQIQGIYQEAYQRREQDYAFHRQAVLESRQISQLLRAETWLQAQGAFRDCPALLETCRQNMERVKAQEAQKSMQIRSLSKKVMVGFAVLELQIPFVLMVLLSIVLRQVGPVIGYLFLYGISSAIGVGAVVWTLLANPQQKISKISDIAAMALCGGGVLLDTLLMCVGMGVRNGSLAITFGAAAIAHVVALLAVLIKKFK